MSQLLVQVRRNPPARASSLTEPDEWTITEDGFRFGKGDRVYNYYDCEWVVVDEDPAECYGGWFSTRRDDGSRGPVLNSVRVASTPPSWVSEDKR